MEKIKIFVKESSDSYPTVTIYDENNVPIVDFTIKGQEGKNIVDIVTRESFLKKVELLEKSP